MASESNQSDQLDFSFLKNGGYGSWDNEDESKFQEEPEDDQESLLTVPDFLYYLKTSWGNKDWDRLVYRPERQPKIDYVDGLLKVEASGQPDMRLILDRRTETGLSVALIEASPSVASTSHPAKDHFFDRFGCYPATSYERWGILLLGELNQVHDPSDPFGKLEYRPETRAAFVQPDGISPYLSRDLPASQRRSAEIFLPKIPDILSAQPVEGVIWTVDHFASRIRIPV